MNTKEASAIRGSKENIELDVGGWRVRGRNMGRVRAITNVEEIAEEAQSAKLETSRWQDVALNEDNNEEAKSKAVLTGLAKNPTRQGRVSPGGVGITAKQDIMVVGQEWPGTKKVFHDNISGEWLGAELAQTAKKEEMA